MNSSSVQAFDFFGYAYFDLSPQGDVRNRNVLARDLLKRKDLVTLEGDKLSPVDPELDERLAEELRRAKRRPGRMHAWSWAPDGRRSIDASFFLSRIGHPQDGFALFIFQRRYGVGCVNIVRSVFSLTRRQAEIACLVASGLSIEELSQQLRIKRTTIRTHLRQTYARINVTSQAQLVAAILPYFMLGERPWNGLEPQ